MEAPERMYSFATRRSRERAMEFISTLFCRLHQPGGGGSDQIVDVAGVDVVAEPAHGLLDPLEEQHLGVPVCERLTRNNIDLLARALDLRFGSWAAPRAAA